MCINSFCRFEGRSIGIEDLLDSVCYVENVVNY